MRYPCHLFDKTALIVSTDAVAQSYRLLLDQAGYQVVLCSSIREALIRVDELLPHLIISDAFLDDGHVGRIFDHVKDDRFKKRVPIIVHLQQEKRPDLAILSRRSFAAFFAGEPLPKTFRAKLYEIEASSYSPPLYWLHAERLLEVSQMALRCKSSLLGHHRDMLVFSSAARLSSHQTYRCLPPPPYDGVVNLRPRLTMRSESGYYAFIPISEAPREAAWLHKLADIPLPAELAAQPLPPGRPRRVLFFHPDVDRHQRFRQLTARDGVEVVYTTELRQAALIFAERAREFGCIYLHELLGHADRSAWLNAFGKLSAADRPPSFISSKEAAPESSDQVHFLAQPVDLRELRKILLTSLEAGQNRQSPIAFSLFAPKPLPCMFEIDTRILGFTESSVIAEPACELAVGSELIADGTELPALWRDASRLVVAASVRANDDTSSFLVRLTAPHGLEKADYWRSMVSRSKGHNFDDIVATPRTNLATFDARLINVFIQAVYEVFEYYLAELPYLGKPHLHKVGQSLFEPTRASVSALTTIHGERLGGYCAVRCEPALLALFALRLLGVNKEKALKDPALWQEVMKELCDQIFGAARRLLESAGFTYELSLPLISLPPAAPELPVKERPIIVIPFVSNQRDFSIDICVAERAAFTPRRIAGMPTVQLLSGDDELRRRMAAQLPDCGLALSPAGGEKDGAFLVVDIETAGLKRHELLAAAAHPRAVFVHRGDADRAIALLSVFRDIRHVHGLAPKSDQLAQLLGRIAKGTHGGLKSVLSEEAIIHTQRARDYQSMLSVLDALEDHAGRFRRLHDFATTMRECAWELISNAFFDAPYDPITGQTRYRGRYKNENITLEAGEDVELAYGDDGRYFAVAVKDQFGSLQRQNVVKGLRRCRQRGPDQVNMSTGAGIGLYMILNAAVRLDLYVVPGIETEIIFSVPIDANSRELESHPRSLHFFTGVPEIDHQSL